MPSLTKHLPISDAVADVLRASTIVADLDHGGFLLTLPEIPDKKLGLQVIKVLAQRGGILRRKLNGYAFATDPRTFMAEPGTESVATTEAVPVEVVPVPPVTAVEEEAASGTSAPESMSAPSPVPDATAGASLIIHHHVYTRPINSTDAREMYEVKCLKRTDDTGRVIATYEDPVRAKRYRTYLMAGHEICRHCKGPFRGHVLRNDA